MPEVTYHFDDGAIQGHNNWIEQELRKAGKRWFSIGSRVIQDEDGTLRTWLNPMDQNKYNCGWFTFDDLRAWARDEGPVIGGRKR